MQTIILEFFALRISTAVCCYGDYCILSVFNGMMANMYSMCMYFSLSFVSVLLSVANADINSASYKDILTWNTPSPLVVRRMSAMITVSHTHTVATGMLHVSVHGVDYFFNTCDN